jgi:WD40 repeat protein
MCCGGADKAAYLLKMPPSQKKIQALVGHDGPVHSVDWSHSGEWVLTGSADRTVRLWTPAHNDPLLTISAVKASTRLKAGLESKASGQAQFPGAISHAIFYYLDKFILLSSSNSLYLYKYYIDPDPTDDIKRYRSLSHYKLVQPLCVEGMQTITAVDCINDFLSHLVLVGGSNKSVDVFDMNVMKKVRSMADCHTRPPHCVSLNKGSRAVSHPGWSYDLFLTAAPLDGVKLWDLRSNRCVRCLSAHVNRCHSVQARFSPCSRYIATGSEDKAAYVYDLRSLSPLHKLSGHSDTVTSLSFHPLKPMLATGTLDGKVTFFTSEGR